MSYLDLEIILHVTCKVLEEHPTTPQLLDDLGFTLVDSQFSGKEWAYCRFAQREPQVPAPLELGEFWRHVLETIPGSSVRRVPNSTIERLLREKELSAALDETPQNDEAFEASTAEVATA